jgi:hypothetical protein
MKKVVSAAISARSDSAASSRVGSADDEFVATGQGFDVSRFGEAVGFLSI